MNVIAHSSRLEIVREEKPVNFFKKVFVDFGLIIPLVIIATLLSLYSSPFKKGYFCSDTTIRYPLKAETVSKVSLYLISLGFPLIFLGMGEILFACEEDYIGDISHNIGKYKVHKGFVRTYDIIVSFLFGYIVCVVIIVLSSNALGEMRPNFIAVCKPTIMCNGARPLNTYIESYNCTCGEKDEIYARQSFPSKHATLCFYTMVYMSVYLQNKVRWDYLSVFNNCMQVTFIITAWFVSLTQVTDFAHHMRDTLAGIVIGSLVAWFNVCAVYNFFRDNLRINKGEP